MSVQKYLVLGLWLISSEGHGGDPETSASQAWERALAEWESAGFPANLQEPHPLLNGAPLLEEAAAQIRSDCMDIVVHLASVAHGVFTHGTPELEESLAREYLEKLAPSLALFDAAVAGGHVSLAGSSSQLSTLATLMDAHALRTIQACRAGEAEEAAAMLSDFVHLVMRATDHSVVGAHAHAGTAIYTSRVARRMAMTRGVGAGRLRRVLDPLLRRLPRGDAMRLIASDVAWTIHVVNQWLRGGKVGATALMTALSDQADWLPEMQVSAELVDRASREAGAYITNALAIMRVLRNQPRESPALDPAIVEPPFLVSSVRSSIRAHSSAATEVNLARVGLAALDYWDTHRVWPQDLDALRSMFPDGRVPRDESASAPFLFELAETGLVITARDGDPVRNPYCRWELVAPN